MSNAIAKVTAVLLLSSALGACTDEMPTASAAAHPTTGNRSTIPTCIAAPLGLISWWPGDGDANDAVDSNHGTLENSATFSAAIVGQGFSFDGIDDFVSVPDSPSLTPPSNSLTLDAWIKPNVVSGPRAILTKYSPALDVSWVLMVFDGYIRFGVYQSGPDDFGRTFDTVVPVVTAGVWQHVAGTFAVATQVVRIYVNGVEVPTTLQPGQFQTWVTSIRDSDSPVRIGALRNGTGSITYYWNGLIDEVDLFDRALTGAEIQAIFSAGSAGKCGSASNRPPVAVPGSNTPNGGYAGLEGAPIAFDGTGSSDPDGDVLTFSWSFGDAATGVGASAAHTYADNGSYTAALTVSDGRGLTDTKSTDVAVANVAPTVTGFSSPTQVALSNGTATAQITNVSFTDPAGAVDAPFVTTIECGNQTNASADGSCVYSAPGVYIAAVRVTDKDGGVSAARTTSIGVAFSFAGFFQPIENLPTINVAKAGSAIPVKFGLGGDYGLAVISVGFPASGTTSCDSTAPTNDVDATTTAGGSSLSYDATTQTYTYVWKTDKSWAATCRQLVLKLIDGTEHRAVFRLK